MCNKLLVASGILFAFAGGGFVTRAVYENLYPPDAFVFIGKHHEPGKRMSDIASILAKDGFGFIGCDDAGKFVIANIIFALDRTRPGAKFSFPDDYCVPAPADVEKTDGH